MVSDDADGDVPLVRVCSRFSLECKAMVQRMLVRLLLAISIALIAFSVYAVYWAWNAEKLPDNQLEIVKVAIQFLLITGVGGVTIWTLNYLNERRREQEHKIQEQITSMHVLLSTISELYRSIKRIKRIMRSRSNWCQADKDIVSM
jgi:large-conductance mechanosensitive channel